jgi:hypothetical protein
MKGQNFDNANGSGVAGGPGFLSSKKVPASFAASNQFDLCAAVKTTACVALAGGGRRWCGIGRWDRLEKTILLSADQRKAIFQNGPSRRTTPWIKKTSATPAQK